MAESRAHESQGALDLPGRGANAVLAVTSAATPLCRNAASRRARATRGALLVVLALAAALGVPGVGGAHDVNSPAGHEAEDAVVHSAATESTLNNTTRIRSAWASQAADAVAAADPGLVGEWGPVENWPVVGIHVALLPNGKVLAWDSVGDAATEKFADHTFTRATVYDPVTRAHTPAWVDTGYNIFCAGFAHLFDGSLFIAGGNKNAQLQGITQTHLFNPVTNGWSLGPAHGGRSLVPVRDAADERRDADHRRRARYSGGTEDRRDAAGTEHRHAQPAALSVDGRRARWSRLLLGAGSDPAEARHGGRGLMADLRAARRNQPRLRKPRGLRHRKDARGRGRVFVEERGRDRHQRRARPPRSPPLRRWPSAVASTTSRCLPTGASWRPAATRPGPRSST